MKNTWLSFSFDDDIREQIFGINSLLDTNKISAMGYCDSHMTAVFFGKRLMGLNKEVLKQINDSICEIVKKYDANITLKFEKFTLFPPNKENIVVALYKPNKVLNNIVKEIKLKFPKLCDETDEFIPHITIGKINNGEEIDINNIGNYPDIVINGLELCGNKIKYIDTTHLFC